MVCVLQACMGCLITRDCTSSPMHKAAWLCQTLWITNGFPSQWNLESASPQWRCSHQQCGLSSPQILPHSIILTPKRHPENSVSLLFLRSYKGSAWYSPILMTNLKAVFLCALFSYIRIHGGDTHPDNEESSRQAFSNSKKLPIWLPQLAVLLLLQ